MSNQPSGPGQSDGARSMSIVLASDHAVIPVVISGATVISLEIDETTLATVAKQDTANVSLASIDTKTPAKGTATAANSQPVVLASDHPALPLPTGAATAAAQTTGNASLASIDAKLTPQGPGPGSATPSLSRLFHVGFTANTAINIDLAGGAYAGLATAIAAGKTITVKATAMCWYNWAAANVTIAAASTAASNPATQGMPLFDGERSDEIPATTVTKLNVLGGAAAGILAIAIAG
jgi:hypothetical protein